MGTCHGYHIASDLEFEYLRHGSANERLEVGKARASQGDPVAGALLAEIERRNGAVTRVHTDGRCFQIWMEGVGWFEVDPDVPSITIPDYPDSTWLEGVLWGLPAALVAIAGADSVFHSSAVDIDGKAVLFTAPGGFGKTTLAAALTARGHRLLGEDLLRCRLGDSPVIFPGPALLRLRWDVADLLHIPGTRVVAKDPEKAHLAIDRTLRGEGSPLPLSAMILLNHGDVPGIEPVDPIDAIRELWTVSLNLPTPEGRAQCFDQLGDLVGRVPTWRLRRPLTFESLDAVCDLVASVA